MDEEKATKLLVKELVKSNGQKFVTDMAYKKHLLEKALSCYSMKHEEPFSFRSKIYWPYKDGYLFSTESYNKGVEDYRGELVKHCKNVNAANYVFVEHTENLSINEKYSLLHLTDTLSFFALIGDKESEEIKRKFYKNVDPEIFRAMNTLNIKHFVHSYKSYEEEPNFARYYRPSDSLDSFLEFVFAIPYEDQNIEHNKEILRRFYYHTDFIEILIREYSNGKHFQEYFDCFDNSIKKTVFDNLKNVQKRNLANDSFLWYAGFKDIRLDHLEFYKNNTKGFIDYFSNSSVEEKKVIIKDIMNCDTTNEEVVNWLNENHMDLVREVGLNG